MFEPLEKPNRRAKIMIPGLELPAGSQIPSTEITVRIMVMMAAL